MKYFLPLAIVTMLFFTQCNSDAPATEATTTTEQTDTTAVTEPAKQVTQIDESAISPSEILKNNEAAYLALRKRVTSNLDTINNRIDRTVSNSTMREGLKKGFQEIVKYDNIQDITKTSETIDAETVEQFMKGIESQLVKLGVQ
ncbi:MAG: hypothetical protein ACRBG0_17970 [Lewinella sp.]|jgi:hypothetical protein|uniref:hypothetical protein n=1 Tax=Lewinella sp. TaxID=2004506 RepID=UPI003D6B10DB